MTKRFREDEDEESLWAAIEGLYAQPGAQDLLIAAQDQAGLDISLFLLMVARAQAGHASWSEASLSGVMARSRDWHSQVLTPFRCARRSAKTLAPDQYEALKALEIQLERAAVAEYLALGQGTAPPLSDVRAYLEELADLSPETVAQLMSLADRAIA